MIARRKILYIRYDKQYLSLLKNPLENINPLTIGTSQNRTRMWFDIGMEHAWQIVCAKGLKYLTLGKQASKKE